MAASNQSHTVGVRDAKSRFSELLELVASGQEIIITKRGIPVAKLVPVKKKASVEERGKAIQRIQKLSKGLTLGGLKIRDLINEGRP